MAACKKRPSASRITTAELPSRERQPQDSPFALHREHRPGIALLVDLLVHLGREGDGAHDAVSELLVHHGLVCLAVILHDLVQAVDERVPGRHLDPFSTVRKPSQTHLQVGRRDPEQRAELVDVLGRRPGMAVEESSHCYLAAAEMVCDLLEGELLACLALEEQRAVLRVAGMLARLDDSGYSRV